MSSIGQRLRDERVRKGLSLEQVADNTRISARYLDALESGDLDRIPGKFFARSFLKQYARALGIDEQELADELDRLTEAEPLPTLEDLDQSGRKRIDIDPIRGEGLPRQRTWVSLGVFVLMVLACSIIYVLFQKTTQAPIPETPVAEQQHAAEQPAVQQPPPVEKPPATAPEQEAAKPTETTKPSEATAPEGQPSQQASAPPPSSPAPAGTPAVTEGTGAVRLQLAASEPAWVRVTVDGKVVMANTLQPGVTKNFDGSKAILIRSGNAGALEISFNGKSVGPIGPKGQIRTVEFTPSEFHPFVHPPKPAAEPAVQQR